MRQQEEGLSLSAGAQSLECGEGPGGRAVWARPPVTGSQEAFISLQGSPLPTPSVLLAVPPTVAHREPCAAGRDGRTGEPHSHCACRLSTLPAHGPLQRDSSCAHLGWLVGLTLSQPFFPESPDRSLVWPGPAPLWLEEERRLHPGLVQGLPSKRASWELAWTTRPVRQRGWGVSPGSKGWIQRPPQVPTPQEFSQ